MFVYGISMGLARLVGKSATGPCGLTTSGDVNGNDDGDVVGADDDGGDISNNDSDAVSVTTTRDNETSNWIATHNKIPCRNHFVVEL